MAYAVELNFEPVVEQRIRSLWGQLSQAGIGSLPTGSGASPHVTLAVYEEIDQRLIEQRLIAFARNEQPTIVTFAFAGTFQGPASVVFLGPVPSLTLLALHARWHAACSDTSSWAHYRPLAWVPHCTLAFDVQPGKIGEGVALARQLAFPLTAEVQSMSLVKFAPVVELAKCPMARA